MKRCQNYIFFVYMNTRIDRSEAFKCAEEGDIQGIQKQLDLGMPISASDSTGMTCLLFAAKAGKLDLVQYLLEQNASLVERDTDGDSAVLYSTAHGHVEVTRWLLDNGANINDADLNRNTLWHGACFKGRLEMAKYLYSIQVDTLSCDIDGDYDFHLAVQGNCTELVKYLIEIKPSKIDILNERNGKTPLHYAAELHNLEIIQLLISSGASYIIKDNSGTTPLLSIFNRATLINVSVNLVEYLMKLPDAPLFEESNDGNNFAFKVVTSLKGEDRMNCIEYLISNGCDIFHTNDDGVSIMNLAEKDNEFKLDLERILRMKRTKNAMR